VWQCCSAFILSQITANLFGAWIKIPDAICKTPQFKPQGLIFNASSYIKIIRKKPQQGRRRMAITGQRISCIIWELNPASDNTISALFGTKGFKIPQPLHYIVIFIIWDHSVLCCAPTDILFLFRTFTLLDWSQETKFFNSRCVTLPEPQPFQTLWTTGLQRTTKRRDGCRFSNMGSRSKISVLQHHNA